MTSLVQRYTTTKLVSQQRMYATHYNDNSASRTHVSTASYTCPTDIRCVSVNAIVRHSSAVYFAQFNASVLSFKHSWWHPTRPVTPDSLYDTWRWHLTRPLTPNTCTDTRHICWYQTHPLIPDTSADTRHICWYLDASGADYATSAEAVLLSYFHTGGRTFFVL